ncbi:MAG TPA: hypothetical protein VN175_04080 [Rhizomicrobium sp.]|nr:hypothetical protein [Rhizomicrobium sp.]
MKAALFVVALVLPSAAFAEAIPAEEAPYHVGETATVVGRASIQKMATGEIYLDLEGRGDGAPLSAYVSRWNAGSFADIAGLDGKVVAITGEIGAFRYRPEIFLTSADQIAVVQPPAPPPPAAPQPLWIRIVPRGR